MVEKKVFNIVYDVWDEIDDSPIPNLKSSYPHFQMNDPSHLILHYQNDASYDDKFEKKKCKLNEVIENPNQKYYYIVNHGGIDAEEFFSYKSEIISEDQTIKPLSQSVIEFIKKYNNFFIIFLTEHEPDSEKSFKIIYNYILNNGIDERKIYIVNNNSKLLDYKIKYESNINVYKLNFIPHSSTKVLVKVGGCEFIENKKGKFFMCFNKSPKVHRYALLCLLKKYNLLEEINWSLVPTWDSKPRESFYFKIFDKEQLTQYNNEIEYFYNTRFKVSDYEVNKNWFHEFEEINRDGFPIWLHNPEHIENYESSYINIVTESKYLDEYNNIHISEKSFRPFFYYQVPLILATHGHIKKMKEIYDFDFFDDIINHSYDDEPNQLKRLHMFVDEIKRLNNNKKNLVEFYRKNKNRFLENKNKVLNILKIVDVDYKFFENLI